MGNKTQNKHLRAHKITNRFFLIVLVPFLVVALLSAIIMFNTKASGGYPNFLGYYAYEIQNDNFKKSTDSTSYPDDPYVKGAVFLFHKVSVDDIQEGDFVIFYSAPNNDDPISSTAPEWVPINTSVTPGAIQFVGESKNLAELKMVQIGSKKATVTAEGGTKYTLFSYYDTREHIGNFDHNHTNSGDEVLIYDNIVGVMAENQNTFLISVLQFCGSTNGFLMLVLVPCVLLLAIKLMSIYFYRRWSGEEELIHDTQIMASDKVSYNQALRGARKKSAPNESGRIISSTQSTQASAIKQPSANASKRGSTVPKIATPKPPARQAPQAQKPVARTAPKPRTQPAPQPVKRSAPKPRTPKTDK